ncbi:MAG TPA: AGE family epimerase/isomerase [Caulobacteraceae bacterium]|nr:AGE family epimerase/isomerase [Caulobacteraceae bacterium]
MSEAAVAKSLQGFKTWLVRDAYPLWSERGRDEAGGWIDRIGLDGRAVAGPQRARVQARQAYAFAVAPAFGWSGDWRAAMRRGLDQLREAYRRPDGLYRTAPGAGGAADLYDQAFVLFALAFAHRAGEDGAAPAAEDLLSRLAPNPRGGFAELDGPALEANPNMHLFEAFMAWSEAGGGTVWGSLADRQAELVATCLLDAGSGAVVEHFGPDWTLPAAPSDRVVDPGHQFEWAWLLLRWSQAAGRARDLRTGLGLIELAERAGVDPARGVAMAALDGDLAPTDRSARLWSQTERLKANVLAARLTGDPGCWAAAEAACETLRRYLDVPVAGLWRDRMLADGGFVDEPAPASSFYHLILAFQELDRLVG